MQISGGKISGGEGGRGVRVQKKKEEGIRRQVL